jgi:hypothetical protein
MIELADDPYLAEHVKFECGTSMEALATERGYCFLPP